MTRTRFRRIAVVAAASVIVAAACGADDQPSATADPEAGGSATTACDVLTAEEATALVGEPVDQADLPDEAALDGDMCIYTPDGLLDEGRPYLGVMLERDTYEAPEDITNGAGGSEVPGLGEFAFSFQSEVEPTVSVYLNPELTFRIWGAGGEVTQERLIEGARLVADEL